jgi:aryl-alcohol dehydrogenase-like predicted oxidoreductase
MTARIGTDLDVFELCLGGNVFGWTLDEAGSFAVLDAYAQAGGNFIDTADSYSAFAPGNSGGESETIIGRWMAARGNRDELAIATKVGSLEGVRGLSAATIRRAAEASLVRLQTDRIDLYYAHRDDPEAPQEETLRAFDELVREGKVRHIAASNFSAERLGSALEISAREGLAAYVALQPHYNLLERDGYEGELRPVCERRGVACVPYFGLARGFLTGKYRPGGPEIDSPRAAGVRDAYANERGWAVLAELDRVAAAHGVPVAAVALAWLRAQPTVAAPIASATSPEQLAELVASTTVTLADDEVRRLAAASA